MSFLDEQKRAALAAPALLALLEDPAHFHDRFAAYREQDGLIDGAFLDRVPPAREVWSRANDPARAVDVLALPLAFREAVLHGLVRDRHVAALNACLAASTDKALHKRLKRLLWELKQAGVDVPDAKPKAAVFRPKSAEPSDDLPCYLSATDSRNERILILHEPLRKGVRVLHVYERDAERVLDFFFGELSRKRSRELVTNMRDAQKTLLFPIDAEFARYLVERLRERAAAASLAFPEGFTSALTRLELDPTPERRLGHPYHDRVDGQAVLERLADLTGCERLHGEPEFKFFTLGRDSLAALKLALDDLQQSGLFINEEQRDDQVRARLTRVLDQFFTPARRAGYAERLRDAAYLLAVRGATGPAQTAAALALYLDDPNRDPSAVAFFQYMLFRLLPPPTPQAPKSESGLIL
jgi:hypothetical protein